MRIVFVFILLLQLIFAGRITPIKDAYISLSTSNPQLSSTYTFHLSLPSGLPRSSSILIEYPPQSYYPGLAASSSSFLVWTPAANLTSSTTLSGRLFTISPSFTLASNSQLNLTIDSLLNPSKRGGTGNFKIYTKDHLNHTIDQAESFGVIGFTEVAVGLIDLQIQVGSRKAGDVVNATIGFTNLEEMVANTKITIRFPKGYGLAGISGCVCQGTAKTWTVDDQNNMQILGFSSIPKGAYVNCSLSGLKNPQYQQITDLFDVSVSIANSFSVVQQGYSNPFYINASAITVLASSNTTLFSNLTRTITLDLQPSNPFSAMKIVSPFSPVTSVLFENGVEATTPNTTILFNVIQLTDIAYQTGPVRLSVTGRLLQQNNNSLTNLIEVYTYLDSQFEFLVDYSNSSSTTQLPIQGSVTNMSTITLTTSSLVSQSTNNLTFTINTPSACNITAVRFEIPQQFTSLGSCSVNGTAVDTCELMNETILIALSPALPSPILVSFSLRNPRIAGSLPISVVLSTNISSYFQSLLVTTTPTTFQSFLVQPIYSVGLKITANISQLQAINGNSLSKTEYTHHSYILFKSWTTIDPYGCDFAVFLSDNTTRMNNAKCYINGSEVAVYGYDSLQNQDVISFIVLANTPTSQLYTLQLHQVYQNVSYLYAVSTFSLPAFANTPASVQTSTISNTPYLGTLSMQSSVNSAEEYLITFPANTQCCSQLIVNKTSISQLTYLNTSTGLVIKNPSSASSQNLTMTGLNLTAGFVNNSVVKITELNNGSAGLEQQYMIQYKTFAENWAIILPINTASFPYSNYTFKFVTDFAQLTQSTIVLTFDSRYDFTVYAPTLEQMLLNGSYLASAPTLSAVGAHTLKLTNWPASLYGNISFTLFGIVNPSAGSYSISVAYVDVLGYQYATSSITYAIVAAGSATTQPPSLAVLPNTTTPSPVPQVLVLSLPFSFLPKDTILTLQFTGLTIWPSTLLLSSGYTDYAITPPSITSTLINHINNTDMSNIELQLYHFNVASNAISVSCTLSYHSKQIYQQSATANLASTSPDSCVAEVQFYPMNSAEVATYDFTIKQLQLQKGMKLGVIFASEFQSQLARRELDIQSQQLDGPISYGVYQRMLVVSGFNSQAQPADTLLSVFGITNPNRNSLSPTSNFTFLVFSSSNTLVWSCQIPGVVLSLPPKVLQLDGISTSQPLSRYVSTYSFSVTLSSMPSQTNGGVFVIDFPEEYWIDSFGGCQVDSSFSLSAHCTVRGYRLTLETYQQEVYNTTSVTLQVSGVRNPEFQGRTSNFIIYVYDTNNQVILSRTYGNVNPSCVASSYAAEDIIVNNFEPLIIQRGFLSDSFYIHFQSPAKVPITLVPNVLSQDLVVLPSFLQVQIGDVDIQFKLATSTGIQATKLQLNWTKANDNIQEVYMPLYRSPILIRDASSLKQLQADVPVSLYQNGSSFSQSICVENPPYNSLSVNIFLNSSCVVSPSPLPQITIVSSCTSYYIKCPLSAAAGSVSLSFSNSQPPIYSLAPNTYTIPLLAYSSSIPSLNSLSVLSTTRTKVTLEIDSPGQMNIHYAVGDCGYQQVGFLQVYNRDPTGVLAWSQVQFGVLSVKQAGVSVHSVQGLEAGHCYQLTFYLVSMFSVQNDTAIVLTATTQDPEQSVQFTLRLRQSEFLLNFESQYLKSIATLLAVDASRLISDNCNETSLDATGVMNWNIVLLANLTNENSNIQPQVLVEYLSSAVETLKGFIPKLISEPIKWKPYLPAAWSAGALSIANIKSTSAVLQFSLPSCLTLSVMSTPSAEPPSSLYQITRLLSCINLPAWPFSVSTKIGPLSQIPLLNLTSLTSYCLQAVVTNFVYNITFSPIVINFTTIKEKQVIDINSIFIGGQRLVIGAIFAAIVVLTI